MFIVFDFSVIRFFGDATVEIPITFLAQTSYNVMELSICDVWFGWVLLSRWILHVKNVWVRWWGIKWVRAKHIDGTMIVLFFCWLLRNRFEKVIRKIREFSVVFHQPRDRSFEVPVLKIFSTKIVYIRYKLKLVTCKQTKERNFKMRNVSLPFFGVFLKVHADLIAGWQTIQTWCSYWNNENIMYIYQWTAVLFLDWWHHIITNRKSNWS